MRSSDNSTQIGDWGGVSKQVTPEPRRNEARGRTETSRASCNWSSIPNSSDFSGVSQPCRIEEAKNFFTGAATERVRAKPLGKASGLAEAKAGLCAQIPRTTTFHSAPPVRASPSLNSPPSGTFGSDHRRPDRETNRQMDEETACIGRPEVCERARNS